MAFPNTPSNGDTTIVNGVTYEYSAAKTAWIRRQVNISDLTLTGNVTANKFYTTEIRWAGNSAVFNAGITYTSSSNPSPTARTGDQWYNTTNDVLYEFVSDGVSAYWVDIQSLGTNQGNAVTVNLDDLTLGGNIILTSNLVYNIGADTGRLKSIYAGNIVSRTANVDTINTGNISAASIAVTSNITAGNITLTSNITAENIILTANTVAGNVRATGNVQGSYMLGDGSKLTGITASSLGAATTGKAIAMAIVFGG